MANATDSTNSTAADAYRTSAFQCPQCANAALREFQDRLVCDECSGMQITADDFTESIRELDGTPDSVELVGDSPCDARCPRCRELMRACKLTLGELAIAGTFAHCPRDGIWIPRDAMTAVFARVSRRGGFRGLGAVSSATGGRSAGGGGGGSALANMPSAHGGMSAPMAQIQNAFSAGSPASHGLAISRWESHRPRVHTLFVSAHKDRELACPAGAHGPLHYQGDRWACATCAGSFVETAALVAMIEEMAQRPWSMPLAEHAAGTRACPICAAAMEVEQLEDVSIDRCVAHGVWFDDLKLEHALHHASVEPAGVIGWLRRLFRTA